MGRDLKKPEFAAGDAAGAAPMVERRGQQGRHAENVGFDKPKRCFDRTVDMTFNRKMKDRLRPVFGKHRSHRRAITNVGTDQDMGLSITAARLSILLA
jgi:hypothetical protein